MIALLALATAPAASADVAKIIQDCAEDGQLNRSYPNRELREAAGNLPADLDEYSDCREVIAAAITSGPARRGKRGDGDRGGGSAGSGGGGSGGGGGGSGSDVGGSASGGGGAATPAEEDSLAALADGKGGGTVGDDLLVPGESGLLNTGSGSGGLPLPLVLALVVLGLLGVVGAVVALRGRIPALARIPGVSRIPSLPRVPRPRVPRLPQRLRR